VGFRSSQAVAADVLNLVTPWAGKIISILICISTLGAINGMIFTGARIYYAMGTDHRMYRWLGSWDPQRGVPIVSLLAQGVVTLAMVVGFGWQAGAHALLAFSAPIFWFFFLMIGLSLFALRALAAAQTEAAPVVPATGTYRVPLYPIVPVLFCLSSLFMLYSSINYAITQLSAYALWALGIMLVGLLLTWAAQLGGTRQTYR
jgi:amino acid transporter